MTSIIIFFGLMMFLVTFLFLGLLSIRFLNRIEGLRIGPSGAERERGKEEQT